MFPAKAWWEDSYPMRRSPTAECHRTTRHSEWWTPCQRWTLETSTWGAGGPVSQSDHRRRVTKDHFWGNVKPLVGQWREMLQDVYCLMVVKHEQHLYVGSSSYRISLKLELLCSLTYQLCNLNTWLLILFLHNAFLFVSTSSKVQMLQFM